MKRKIKLTGAQKTAIFLLSLDGESLGHVWGEFDEIEQEKIVEAIYQVQRMRRIDKRVYDYITYEFALFDEILSKFDHSEKEFIISAIKDSASMDIVSKYNFINDIMKEKERFIEGGV